MKCTLSVEVNNCPFCNKDNMECNNNKNCAFQMDKNSPVKDKYVRQERWYEKYYKNNKTR